MIQPGDRFGRWTTVERLGPNKSRNWFWLCACECGASKTVLDQQLRSGKSRSCGCFREATRHLNNRRHGLNETPEHQAWMKIRQRCLNPRSTGYEHYGGRGIKVCARWLLSFDDFLADMGKRPGPTHSIDRIDVNGHYEPSNCRWATKAQQARNTRATVYLEAFGVRRPVADWCEELGLDNRTVRKRIASGWPAERCLTRPGTGFVAMREALK